MTDLVGRGWQLADSVVQNSPVSNTETLRNSMAILYAFEEKGEINGIIEDVLFVGKVLSSVLRYQRLESICRTCRNPLNVAIIFCKKHKNYG